MTFSGRRARQVPPDGAAPHALRLVALDNPRDACDSAHTIAAAETHHFQIRARPRCADFCATAVPAVTSATRSRWTATAAALAALYAPSGRPSIPPEQMLQRLVLQAFLLCHNGPQDLNRRRSAVCVEPRLITTRSVRRAGPWSSSARFLNRSVRQAAARRISLTERRTRQAYRRRMQTSTTSRSRLRRSRGRLCDLDERFSVLQRLDDPREFRVEATQHLRARRVADSEPTRRKVRRATGRVRRNPRPS
jgi:hypothetical protein